MIYPLHVAVLLAAFYLYYRFFLRSETHFDVNRVTLLLCLLGAFALPLITVPAQYSLRSVTTEVAVVPPVGETESPPLNSSDKINSETSGVGEEERKANATAKSEAGHETAQRTAITSGVSIAETSLPEEQAMAPTLVSRAEELVATTNWKRLLFWVYALGVGVFALHFLFQLSLLFLRMWRNPGYDLGKFRIVEVEADIAPYSFWNRIFINPARYDEDTFHQIVEHEAIHIQQRHSLDLLLAEALVILQWWNPFAWKYRSAVEHNLEFLTDAAMLAGGANPQLYQLNLLKVAVPTWSPGLTLSYNQSFLEKRIDMMKTKKSSTRTAWKYLALLPLMLLAVLQFNPVSSQSEPKPQPEENLAIERPTVATPVPAPRPSVRVDVNPVVGVSPAVSASPTPVVTVNPVVDVRPTPVISGMSISTPDPRPSRAGVFSRHPELAKMKRSWIGSIEDGALCIEFLYRGDNNRHHSNHHECFDDVNLSTLPRGQMGTFTITRPAGTMELKGQFDGDDGLGSFEFKPDAGYFQTFAQAGYSDYDNFEKSFFFFSEMEADFPAFLNRKGYKPDSEKLMELAIFGYNKEVYNSTIAELGKMGYEDLSLQQLIEVRIFDLTPEYARELTASGFPRPTFQKLLEAKIHDVDGELVQGLAKAGYQNLELATVTEMAIHGIDKTYVDELASIGYEAPDARQLITAKVHGVDAAAVSDLANAGIKGLSLEEISELTIHGVDADYARRMKEAGFGDLSKDQLLTAKIHNFDPNMLAGFKGMNLPTTDFDELVPYFVHNVTPDFIKSLQEVGYKDLDMDEYLSARIHGISPSYVRSFEDTDLGFIEFDDLMSMRIHGVTPAYVKKNKDRGRTPQDFVQMKIHGR